jgi:hypothetical protein
MVRSLEQARLAHIYCSAIDSLVGKTGKGLVAIDARDLATLGLEEMLLVIAGMKRELFADFVA